MSGTDNIIFHEGELPSGYVVGFECSLFNLNAHLLLQSATGWRTFYILDQKRGKTRALINFNIQDSTAYSPLRSTYGSLECDDEIQPAVLYDFFKFIESALVSTGINRIIIKNAPLVYNAHVFSLLQVFLFNQGYTVIDAEVDSFITITNTPLASRLNARGRKKLDYARDAKLSFHLLPNDECDTVYHLIEQWHARKGYTLSMPFQKLEEVIQVFPDRYSFFAVKQNARIVAACITIRVKSNILYYFFSNNDEAFNAVSPAVFMIEGLYSYCRKENITLLDLGTSALYNEPNFGLLDFKLQTGATPSAKLTFQKDL